MTKTSLAKAFACFSLTVLFFGAFALVAPQVSHSDDSCKRTSFKTVLVKEACLGGGRSAAKKAMKEWVKSAKKKKAGLECATCHSSMAPDYALTADALKLFKELGGK